MKNVFDAAREDIEFLQLMIENSDIFRRDFSLNTPFGKVDIPEEQNVLAICHIALGYKQRHLAKLQDMAARDSLLSRMEDEL